MNTFISWLITAILAIVGTLLTFAPILLLGGGL
jgi:hypothetical protein